MNEAPDAEGEPAGYIRLPWQLVGAGLFVLLAAVLGLGLFANRNLRPQIGIVPTPSPVAVATSTAPPVAAPAIVQVSTPTTAPSALVSETARSTAPTSTATAVPTDVPVAALTVTPLPTVQPELADEVAKSYMLFWRVTSQALLELDDSHLREVMDGDYLATVANRIDELRKEGRAIKTMVVLNYAVISATQDSATVVDDLEDNSIYVKIGTEDPLSDPVSDQFRVLYTLHNFSGIWKVVDSVRS